MVSNFGIRGMGWRNVCCRDIKIRVSFYFFSGGVVFKGIANVILSDMHQFQSGWRCLCYRQWGLASTHMYVFIDFILQPL